MRTCGQTRSNELSDSAMVVSMTLQLASAASSLSSVFDSADSRMR
jgi:hypothetical protein